MFWLLFISFSLLGIYSYVNFKIGFLISLFLALTLPLSNYYSEIHYLNGIMVFDGYIIGLIPLLLRKMKSQFTSNNRDFIFVSIILLASVAYVIYAISCQREFSAILKDLRPLLFLLSILLLIFIARTSSLHISSDSLFFLANLAAISNILWMTLGFLKLMPTGSDDLYIENNIFRYFDLSTYFSAYFIIYSQYLLSSTKRIYSKRLKISLAVSFISILISNSRMLLFAVIFCSGYLRTKSFKQLFQFSIVAIVLFGLFFWFSDKIDQGRIFESLSSEGLFKQFNTRFSPAISAINSMNGLNFIFGLGLGYFFKIPWFEYRGMDIHNASLDSTYLTHYVKQGIFGLYLVFFTIRRISNFGRNKLSKAFLIFWILIFLISAPLYQNVIYGALLFYCLIVLNQKYPLKDAI